MPLPKDQFSLATSTRFMSTILTPQPQTLIESLGNLFVEALLIKRPSCVHRHLDKDDIRRPFYSQVAWVCDDAGQGM